MTNKEIEQELFSIINYEICIRPSGINLVTNKIVARITDKYDVIPKQEKPFPKHMKDLEDCEIEIKVIK